MLRQSGKLGKLAATRPNGVADLIAYARTPLPTPPLSVDYTELVGSWEMADNDKLGCCTIAGITHMDKSWCAQTQETYTYPGDDVIQEVYMGLTGGEDSGLVESSVLSTFRTTGLFGRTALQYGSVNVKDLTALKVCTHLFGGLYVGIQLPQIAEEQFQNGQPWALTGNPDVDQNIIGGHAVTIQGYDANNNFKVITWGGVQIMEWSWWQQNGDEAWAIVPEEFADALNTLNIDVHALEQDLADVN